MFNKKRFMAKMILKEKTIKGLANEIGMSSSSLYKKINNRSQFYCFEMKKLSKILEIDNPIEYFYNDNEIA